MKRIFNVVTVLFTCMALCSCGVVNLLVNSTPKETEKPVEYTESDYTNHTSISVESVAATPEATPEPSKEADPFTEDWFTPLRLGEYLTSNYTVFDHDGVTITAIGTNYWADTGEEYIWFNAVNNNDYTVYIEMCRAVVNGVMEPRMQGNFASGEKFEIKAHEDVNMYYMPYRAWTGIPIGEFDIYCTFDTKRASRQDINKFSEPVAVLHVETNFYGEESTEFKYDDHKLVKETDDYEIYYGSVQGTQNSGGPVSLVFVNKSDMKMYFSVKDDIAEGDFDTNEYLVYPHTVCNAPLNMYVLYQQEGDRDYVVVYKTANDWYHSTDDEDTFNITVHYENVGGRER